MDSNKIAEIADVMEGRGLTRVRVEEPDGSAFELERAVREAAPAVVMPQVVASTAVAAPLAVPSTIVDCTGASPRILREGAIPAADVL